MKVLRTASLGFNFTGSYKKSVHLPSIMLHENRRMQRKSLLRRLLR